MSEQRAQELIVGCLAASSVIAAGSTLASHKTPGIRLVVGVAATGIGLATVSMFSPDLAGGMAVLILTSTVFVYGQPFMDALTSLTNRPTSSTSKAPSTPPPTGPGVMDPVYFSEHPTSEGIPA